MELQGLYPGSELEDEGDGKQRNVGWIAVSGFDPQPSQKQTHYVLNLKQM
jgi:hypothetical protein